VGTADAIYQNLYLLERSGAELVLILSGDHVYRMDYAAMLEFHRNKGADVTIASMEVRREEAQAFGVLSVDENNRIAGFQEKPLNPIPMPNKPDFSLASMGIYIFSLGLLSGLLKLDHQNQVSGHDFGKDILPSLVRSHRMVAYRFGGATGRVTQDRYWRDVGTIDAYYEANMDLLKPKPSIDLYQKDWPIRTYEGQYPPARTVAGKAGKEAVIINCMLASGTIITGGLVTRSILFPNTRVEEGAVVEASLLFEGVTVGAEASLKKCIIDKNVRIPAGETIGLDPVKDAERFTISERGVAVVPQGYRFGL
jgi:glucose-1-phosphate adenylyltransferase